MTKYCKDCKYLGVSLKSFCKSPNNGIDIVSGDIKSYWAVISRGDKALCGVEAKWFEPVEQEKERTTWLTKLVSFFMKK